MLRGRRSRMPHRARSRVISAATLLAAAGFSSAADNTWDAPAATSGSWFDPQHWSLDRLPTPADAASIHNGGTALIASGSAAAGQLSLGSGGVQTGFLNQSAGSLSVTDLTVAAQSEPAVVVVGRGFVGAA